MAKQIGIIKLDGIMDNIVFYKSSDGYIARMHTPITAERIASDPSFARTRENMSEFGRAGKGARLLRVALRAELQKVSDRRASNRLLRELMQVLKSDAENPRGQRTLVSAEKTSLVGFDFNANAPLGSTFFAPFTATLDRATGAATVTLPIFTPANAVEAPAGATHFRINTAVVSVDFFAETYAYAGAHSTEIKLDSIPTTELSLTANLGPNPTGALFVVVGIEFFQQVNSINYALNNGAFNALAIAKVEQEG
ncbi:MAG TPA: hypothetical protein VGE66_15435 [Chitinophagaceae bacterium]